MSGRIRVLFAIGSLSGGGSERQLVQLLQHLDRDRFEPLLYLVYRTGELLPEVPADVPIASCDTRTRAPLLYWPGRMHRRRVLDLAAFLSAERVDVVYDRTFHTTLMTAPAARRAGVPRVSTVVTDPAHDFVRIAGRFRGVKYRLLRRAYQDAAAVVAVSRGVADSVREFYRLPECEIRTIYNGIDLQRVDRQMAAASPFAEDAGAFRIVATGRLHAQKGFLILLTAMHELVHHRGQVRLRLHLLGAGPQEAELREFVSAHRLGDHVVLEGYRSDAPAWFRHANLFCLPSLYEGMPNALLEAMACRVPVLASDCPHGPREILEDGRLGRLVPPNDPRGLADEIEDLMTHESAARRPIAAARQRVEEHFAVSAGTRHLELLLQAVAGSAGVMSDGGTEK